MLFRSVKRYYTDIVAKIRNLLEENIVLVNSSSFTSVWLIEDSSMHGHWHDTSMSPEAVKEEDALKELCSASGVELRKMNIPGKLRFDLCLEIKLTRDLSSTQQVVPQRMRKYMKVFPTSARFGKPLQL